MMSKAAAPLQAPKPTAGSPATHKCMVMCESFSLFARQPSGVPILVVSYALLWFTVLSPHGVVLTAYLQAGHPRAGSTHRHNPTPAPIPPLPQSQHSPIDYPQP